MPKNFNEINYNRFNVHTLANNQEFLEAIQAKVTEITAAEQRVAPELYANFDAAEKNLTANSASDIDKVLIQQYKQDLTRIVVKDFVEDYKKLFIYYGFQARDSALAIKYAYKYKACVHAHDAKDSPATYSYAQAESESYVGYAEMMHPDITLVTHSVNAVSGFEALLNHPNDAEKVSDINMQIAFAKRYIGLGERRKKNAAALQFYSAALEIQKSLVNDLPGIKIDIAETLHLIAALNDFLKNYVAAKHAYEEALRFENEFIAETQAPHFMKWITAQSLGLVYSKTHEYDAGIKLLTETAQEQEIFYHKREHADIAKTLNFLAETYLALENWPQAINFFLQALDIKEMFYKTGDFVLVITQKMLLVTLNKDFEISKVSAVLKIVDRLPADLSVLKLNSAEQASVKELLLKVSNSGIILSAAEQEILNTAIMSYEKISGERFVLSTDRTIAESTVATPSSLGLFSSIAVNSAAAAEEKIDAVKRSSMPR